jgi:hypothetical protein
MTPDSISRYIELASSVGLIASCVLLFRFFRGGIMASSFMLFSIGSVLFFVDRVMTALIDSSFLPENPFTLVHLSMETMFAILFMVGFILLYKNWTKVQRPVPERYSETIPQ